MSDLEDRLRAAATRRSHDFDPSPDLPDRIVARVDHHRRVRRLVAGTALTAAAAAVVVIVALVGSVGRDEGSMWATDGGRPPTTLREPVPALSTTSTTATTATTGGSDPSTSGSGSDLPAAPEIGVLTPLSRHGIGPIRAGMTLRAAQDAAGVTITPAPGGSGDCAEAHVEGLDPSIVLVVEPAGAGAGPMDGVVRAVAGSVAPTADGAMVGDSRDQLVAALGPPTDSSDRSSTYGPGAELLVFESGGFAYGALVVNDMVLGLQSGHPAWVGYDEGCPP